MMTSLFWNVRGLNDPNKVSHVATTIKAIKPDIIALSETKKMDFSPTLLNTLVGPANFSWNFLPDNNTAGGILLGINDDAFDTLVWSINSFSATCSLRDKKDNFEWLVVAVYGSAYEDHKQEFIDELHKVSNSSTLPLLIGGDFNLVREAADKNNGNINLNWTSKFNDWTNCSALMELKLANRQFTWSNNQANNIMASIDRLFMTTCWDSHYPSAVLSALPRVGSDHTPLVVQCGLPAIPSKKVFRFEKW